MRKFFNIVLGFTFVATVCLVAYTALEYKDVFNQIAELI